MSNKQLRLRRPEAEDGAALFRLVRRCPPLDEHSRYRNLLQVTHFRRAAIVAESGNRPIRRYGGLEHGCVHCGCRGSRARLRYASA
jgi:hypothetical protein